MQARWVILYIAFAGSMGAALAADPANRPAPWAGAGDESGRPAERFAGSQDPNASSRGAAAPKSTHSEQVPAQSEQATSPAASSATAPSTGQRRHAAGAGGSASRSSQSSDASKQTRAERALITDRAPSAAAGASGADEASRSPAQGKSTTADYILSRGRDWGWLGLLGLFGLLGLLRRPRHEREIYTGYAPTPEEEARARGVRVYETPEPAPRA